MTYDLFKGRTPTNVSIDKIDSTKGYTKNNIQLICMECNQMKSDITEDELYDFCKSILENLDKKKKKIIYES